jgi:hypothetical protein
VADVEAVDLPADAPPRRHAARHGAGGSNINYVQPEPQGIRMRTFERGVEAETLSCGSGVVAAALSALRRAQAKAPWWCARAAVCGVEATPLGMASHSCGSSGRCSRYSPHRGTAFAMKSAG